MVVHVNEEHFPMMCITVSTFMSMDRMLSHGILKERGLLVRPESGSKVHFLSHEWLAYAHPDPRGVQLRRMQVVFRSLMSGQVQNMFEENAWETFSQGTSVTWKPSLANVEGDAHTKVSEHSFAEDVCCGLVWLDFSSVPQLVDASEEDYAMITKQQRCAVASIPRYLECSTYFWVVTIPAEHKDEEKHCDFFSWQQRGWCRLEQWANLLSVKSFMPLIVTDSEKIITYSLVAFQLSHMQKFDLAPCNGHFSCCRMNHVAMVGNIPHNVTCDKEQISMVLTSDAVKCAVMLLFYLLLSGSSGAVLFS